MLAVPDPYRCQVVLVTLQMVNTFNFRNLLEKRDIQEGILMSILQLAQCSNGSSFRPVGFLVESDDSSL